MRHHCIEKLVGRGGRAFFKRLAQLYSIMHDRTQLCSPQIALRQKQDIYLKIFQHSYSLFRVVFVVFGKLLEKLTDFSLLSGFFTSR